MEWWERREFRGAYGGGSRQGQEEAGNPSEGVCSPYFRGEAPALNLEERKRSGFSFFAWRAAFSHAPPSLSTIAFTQKEVPSRQNCQWRGGVA